MVADALAQALPTRGAERGGEIDAGLADFRLIVITSYSIHYTKLYEVGPDRTPQFAISVTARLDRAVHE